MSEKDPRPQLDDAWLVLPLYNEEEAIGKVVSEALTVFPNVVCIDDGSTDGSARAAREAGAHVLQHPINLGQGAALQTGINYVCQKEDDLVPAKYVVTFDADGQHDVHEAAQMVQKAKDENLAIVYGTRFKDNRSNISRAKKIVLKTAAAVTRWKTGLKITDAHNGLRVLRMDAAKQLNLQQDRMAHASEIVAQLGKTKLPWDEMPVTITYTDYSRAKGQSLLNSVNILVELLMG